MSEDQNTQQADGTLPVESVPQSVPYDRFKEVISQKKALEAQLSQLAEAQSKSKAAAEAKVRAEEEASLAEKGNYEALKAKLEAERASEKAELTEMAKSGFLASLGARYNIAKPEYLKLFSGTIDVEGTQIKNAEDVMKAFEKFKEENPTLFEVMESATSPGSGPVKRPSDTIDPTKVSGLDLIRMHYEKQGIHVNKAARSYKGRS